MTTPRKMFGNAEVAIIRVGVNTGRLVRKVVRKHLNFYRIHTLYFLLFPIFWAGIFYACNGEHKVSFIDALFTSYSSMAVCGLATIDLSSITPWQQVILFIQMCQGHPIVISWFMVFIRRRYIRNHCSHILLEYMVSKDAENRKQSEEKRPAKSGLRPDMIRRVDDEPRLVRPDGVITDGALDSRTGSSPNLSVFPIPSGQSTPLPISSGQSTPLSLDEDAHEKPIGAMLPTPEMLLRADSNNPGFPRTLTVEFADLPRPRPRLSQFVSENGVQEEEDYPERTPRTPHFPTHVSLNLHPTHQSARTHHSGISHHSMQSGKHRGFGGFPTPYAILRSLFKKFFPSLDRKLTRTLTMPAPSLVSIPTRHATDRQLRATRNSDFPDLTVDELCDIAYTEFQALGMLLWVVLSYHIVIQLVGFIVIAPYISTSQWRSNFQPPTNVVRPVNSVWFSAFQVASAYTNTGTSLVDTSMISFQKAYLMVLFMAFLILAGNTCFPIFLRLLLNIMKKCTTPGSPRNKTLTFLLNHPRRCYIYLFPARQTYALLAIVIILTGTDWLCFIVLDIGNEAIWDIPGGVRALAGFMQAIAVRAAGFAIVPLNQLAPAVKVLYVVMMYISIYPIAMSVRSTNVYEEKSLGIFPAENAGVEEDDHAHGDGSRVEIWSRYLASHLRAQLAFDMWWICIAIFAICALERSQLNNPENASWFNIFNIIFEVISAYGTVGLSLGVGSGNYSFSGAFHPVSKLIVCLVMLRGRHRGLPVAIDRAIMFPKEFERVATMDTTNGDSQMAETVIEQRRETKNSLLRFRTRVGKSAAMKKTKKPLEKRLGAFKQLLTRQRTHDTANGQSNSTAYTPSDSPI